MRRRGAGKLSGGVCRGGGWHLHEGLPITGWWFPPSRRGWFINIEFEGHPQTPSSHHPGSLHLPVWQLGTEDSGLAKVVSAKVRHTLPPHPDSSIFAGGLRACEQIKLERRDRASGRDTLNPAPPRFLDPKGRPRNAMAFTDASRARCKAENAGDAKNSQALRTT